MAGKKGKNGTDSGVKKEQSKSRPHQGAKGKREAPADRAFLVVGVGASAGGLEALYELLDNVPQDCGMAFVVVVHLEPSRSSEMPELLQRRSYMRVVTAEDGMPVEPDRVYVIPPGADLTLEDGVLRLPEREIHRGAPTPINHFLRSLAWAYGQRAACILLSGMGTDGTLGLREVKTNLGMTMAQEPDSAGFASMPVSAINTGMVDFVLRPEEMPEQLVRYHRHLRSFQEAGNSPEELGDRQEMRKVFAHLRAATGHDFSSYKPSTVARRVQRRLHVHQIDSLSDYVGFMQGHPEESRALFKELLIGVTSFFREPETFRALQEDGLPRLFERRAEGEELRIWVPGCSTGEEAYSLAVVARELLDRLGRSHPVQIFATDIDDEAVARGREGVFPDSIATDVSRERLERFFTREDGAYRINKNIRDMLIFASQNVIKDPPFTRLDLISCRNLLIYLNNDIQKKLLPLFHYSLEPGGILVLGSSESAGGFSTLFETVDKQARIYRRREVTASQRLEVEFPLERSPQGGMAGRKTRRATPGDVSEVVLEFLLSSYSPPCVLVDENNEILYFHGRTGLFLEPAQGEARLNLLGMARSGLESDLSTLVHRARREGAEVARRGVKVRTNGETVSVDLKARPMKDRGPAGSVLVIFERADRGEGRTDGGKTGAREGGGSAGAAAGRETAAGGTEGAGAAARGAGGQKAGGGDAGDAVGAERRVRDLETELKRSREDLRTTIEELETSNEELRSSNEEYQSTNEELQSANEELESSKEEMQSLNEELATVNSELQAKVEEVSGAYAEVQHFLNRLDIPVVYVDDRMRVRRFSARATEIVSLIDTDVGRPLEHLSSRLKGVDLTEQARRVIRTGRYLEKAVETADGRWYLMRLSPYRGPQEETEGALISFLPFPEGGKADRALKESRERSDYWRSVVESIEQPILVLDGEMQVISANASFHRTFRLDRDRVAGSRLFDLDGWDMPDLESRLKRVLPELDAFAGLEAAGDFPGLGRRELRVTARRLESAAGGEPRILVIVDSVSAAEEGGKG